MISITKFISETVVNGFRQIKMLRFGKNDATTSYVSSWGIQYMPNKGAKLVEIDTTNSSERVAIGEVAKADDNINQGDLLLHNPDSNTTVYLRADGTIEIVGNTDNAVRYSELETAFNQLKEDFNKLQNDVNTFSTAYVAGGPSTQGTPPAFILTSAQSNADIAPSKIEQIKVP